MKVQTSGGVFGIIHDGEDIKCRVLKASAAFLLLKQGKIVSSPAVISLQWLELNRAAFLTG
ncbi:hypothetical protein [Acidovorax sp. BLS4]|uniref:hypothetical protein n=1 Tax=Acidovorax sp. BLS4 TaxID=3273430 RepID=UPI002943235B|nr:hypothetical protein [Paracidovorax avenae]WOI45603.1 hypothetical protein R1Z03_24650 [Paracidovorax avenae]